MARYIVDTILKVTKEYALRYELELDHYPTVEEVGEHIPDDEEYITEECEEEIISVEKL